MFGVNFHLLRRGPPHSAFSGCSLQKFFIKVSLDRNYTWNESRDGKVRSTWYQGSWRNSKAVHSLPADGKHASNAKTPPAYWDCLSKHKTKASISTHLFKGRASLLVLDKVPSAPFPFSVMFPIDLPCPKKLLYFAPLESSKTIWGHICRLRCFLSHITASYRISKDCWIMQ